MRKSKILGVGVGVLTAALLSACGDGDGGSATGTLNLGITDAPVDDASAVYVQFSGVQIHGAGGTVDIDFDPPRQIDLLALSGGGSELLLENQTLDAGAYQWIRLMVDTQGELDTYIETATGSHELVIPSGSETGLKLVRGFTVPAGGTADFTIDFDLRKSIVLASDGYKLRPTLRLIDNAQVGTVAGLVDLTALGCEAGGNAVYVFEGHDAALSDIDTSSDSGPLSTANVTLDEEAGVYGYRAAFLSPGEYTVALTCEADRDMADTQEADLAFAAWYNVTVVANETFNQDFFGEEML